MPHKLIYFNIRGRGQAIQYSLRDNAIAYDEEALVMSDWPQQKSSYDTKFGKLPKFVFEDGFELCDSKAIIRHIGRIHDLYGSSLREKAIIDMVLDVIEDMRRGLKKQAPYRNAVYLDQTWEKQAFIDGLAETMNPLQEMLGWNEGDGGFIASNKMSIADYALFDLLDLHLIFSAECLDKYPALKDYHSRIAARPNIAAYRAEEVFKSRPVFGRPVIWQQ